MNLQKSISYSELLNCKKQGYQHEYLKIDWLLKGEKSISQKINSYNQKCSNKILKS